MKVKNIIIYVISAILLLFIGFITGYYLTNKNATECADVTELNETIETNKTEEKNNEEKNDAVTSLYTEIDNNKLEITNGDESELTNNIQIISKYVSANKNYVIIHAKNNNTSAVKARFELNYYDSEGYNINYAYQELVSVLPGKDFVISINTYNNKNSETVKYDMKYTASKLQSYYTPINLKDSDLDSIDIDNKIQINYKNNLGKEAYSISAACIYYKDKKEVFAGYAYIGKVIKDAVGQGYCYGYQLGNVEYDEYKVVLSSAYEYHDEGW